MIDGELAGASPTKRETLNAVVDGKNIAVTEAYIDDEIVLPLKPISNPKMEGGNIEWWR